MWLKVPQIVPGQKSVINKVNTDLIERVHDNGETGMTLHFTSGNAIEIEYSMEWWEKVVPSSGD